MQELRDEEKAATKHDEALPIPAEPLPREVQEVLDGGQAAISNAFTTLTSKLAATLTTTKAGMRKSGDEYITAAMAEAEKRAEEAEIEAADRGAEIDRLDQEVESLQSLLDQKAAEVPPLKEALVVAREKTTALESDRDTASKERTAAALKAEEVASELAAMRENVAVIVCERDSGARQIAELQAQLEAALEKIGALCVELSEVKQLRAELAGENRQLISEREHYREAARAERQRVEEALEEARAAKAEVAKLSRKKAANGNQTCDKSGAVPTAPTA